MAFIATQSDDASPSDIVKDLRLKDDNAYKMEGLKHEMLKLKSAERLMADKNKNATGTSSPSKRARPETTTLTDVLLPTMKRKRTSASVVQSSLRASVGYDIT